MISYHPARLTTQGEIVGDSPTVVLEPETWIGRKFPLLKHIEINADLAKGEWLVVFYHRNCPVCQEVIGEYEQFASVESVKGRICQVALIEVPEKNASHWRPEGANMVCRQGRLSDENEWLIHTPMALRVKNGRTIAVASKPLEWLVESSTSSGG